MRTHGTLAKWHDDRGFGFIVPAQGGDEVFVHVSAFPRDGARPRVAELISFEIEVAADGRRRATRVLRPDLRAARQRSRRAEPSRRRRFPRARTILLMAASAIAAYGYSTLESGQHMANSVPAPALIAPLAASQVFQCDGRTRCNQMSSCAEATYFLRNCPGVQMDGDYDGSPCEDQWCRE